jgi:hypothetical protein
MATMRSADDEMPSTALTARQRLALTHGLVDAPKVLGMADEKLDFAFLRAIGSRAAHFRAARLDALAMKKRGASRAVELREVGFDALDLTCPAFCSSCVSAFGAADVCQCFLVSAGDAVALAGTSAMWQLSISAQQLLQNCAGCAAEADAVLAQLEPRGAALSGVSVHVLLDTGLRATALSRRGYHLAALSSQLEGCSPGTLSKLGF